MRPKSDLQFVKSGSVLQEGKVARSDLRESVNRSKPMWWNGNKFTFFYVIWVGLVYL